MAVNLALTMGLFVLGFAVALALTIPDVPVGLLIVVFVPLMIVLPIVFYPFSKTLWMAFDRAVLQRLDPKDALDEQARHF